MIREIEKTNHNHINEIIDKYNIEVDPFKKIHILIDLFEVIVETHVAYTMGVFLKKKILVMN